MSYTGRTKKKGPGYYVSPDPFLSCAQKQRYSTEKLARHVAHKAAQRAGHPIRTYPCHFCGGFHLTKSLIQP